LPELVWAKRTGHADVEIEEIPCVTIDCMIALEGRKSEDFRKAAASEDLCAHLLQQSNCIGVGDDLRNSEELSKMSFVWPCEATEGILCLESMLW
jgi:hypothetical protein